MRTPTMTTSSRSAADERRDSILLDMLDEEGHRLRPRDKWVCRKSTTGRGIRLHQVKPEEIDKYGRLILQGQVTKIPTWTTPREALEHFLR